MYLVMRSDLGRQPDRTVARIARDKLLGLDTRYMCMNSDGDLMFYRHPA